MFPSPAQLRAARAMLDWSLVDMSKAAGVSVSVALKAEGRHSEQVAEGIWGALRVAMETAGVRFLEDDRDGAGVRLRLS